jgi:carbonic anhydrase
MKSLVANSAILLLVCCCAPAQQPATAAHASQHSSMAASAAPSGDQIWAELIAGNQRFITGKARERNLVQSRQALAKSQHPKAIILSCSDSRVSPELVFDQGLGDLFVVRTAGNIADPVALGSMEYAAENLGSTVLVVLGHTKCGAVTAACSGDKMQSSNLQAIVDKISPAVSQARTAAKPDDLVETAIKDNVHQSAKDVLANSEILRHEKEQGKLTVFEAEYQLDTGEIVRLDGPKQ